MKIPVARILLVCLLTVPLVVSAQVKTVLTCAGSEDNFSTRKGLREWSIVVNESKNTKTVSVNGVPYVNEVQIAQDVIRASHLLKLESDPQVQDAAVMSYISINRVTGDFTFGRLPIGVNGVELTREKMEAVEQRWPTLMFQGTCRRATPVSRPWVHVRTPPATRYG